MSKNKPKKSLLKIINYVSVILSLGYGVNVQAGTANLTGQYFGKHELIMATPGSGEGGFSSLARQVRNEDGSTYGILGWNMNKTYWLWDFDTKTITFGSSNLAALNFFATPPYRVYSPDRERVDGEATPPDLEGVTDVEQMKGTFVDNGDGTYSASFNLQIYLIMAGFPMGKIEAKYEISKDENGYLSITTLDEAPDGILGADGKSTDNVPGVVLPATSEGPGGVFPLRVSPYWNSDKMTKITTDLNNDGLPDIISQELGLLIGSTDTDADGMSDLDEIGDNWAMPLDSDNDGIIDALEAGDAANNRDLFNNMSLSSNEKVTVKPLNGETFFRGIDYYEGYIINYGTPEAESITIKMIPAMDSEAVPLEPQWIEGETSIWQMSEESKNADKLLPVTAPNGKPYIYDLGTFQYFISSSFSDYDTYKGIEKVVNKITSAENAIESNEAKIEKYEQLVTENQTLLDTAIAEGNTGDIDAYTAKVEKYEGYVETSIAKRDELASNLETEKAFVADFIDNSSYTSRGIALFGNDFTSASISSLADLEALATANNFVGEDLADDASYEMYFEHGVPQGLKVIRLRDIWAQHTTYADDGITPTAVAPIAWQPEIEDVITKFHEDGKTITITHERGSTTSFYSSEDAKNFVDPLNVRPVSGEIYSNMGRYQIVLAHTESDRASVINNTPVIEGEPNISIEENIAYSFIPTAIDDDGDTLTFSISNKPSWASFNTTTGELSGTPTSTDIGSSTDIVITASDSFTSIDLPAFNLEVTQKTSNTDDGSSSGGSFFWLLLPSLLTFALRLKKNQANRFI